MYDLENDVHPLITRAIAFARHYHEDTKPGYFDDHVMAVVREVCKHTSDIDTIIAAVFHDLFEDTTCTVAEAFQAGFSWETIAYSVALIDAAGANRKERKAKTYYEIRQFPQTILIKLCDRLDNLRRCMRDPKKRYGDMYVNEDYSFRCGLWTPDYADIWQEYSDLITILARKA